MPPTDYQNDTGLSMLTRLSETRPALRQLLTEKRASLRDDPGSPDHAFAWPEVRMFRTDSPESALVSLAYAEAQRDAVPSHVLDGIKLACELHGVPQDALREDPPAARPDEDFLVPELRAWPMKTAAEASMALQKFASEGPRLPFLPRAAWAREVVRRAKTAGVEAPAEVLRDACLTLPDAKLAYEALLAREGACSNPDHADRYARIRHALPGRLTQADAVKIGSALATLDEMTGVSAVPGVQDPVRSLWSLRKAGMDIMLGGTSVDVSRLMELPEAFWTQALGPDGARDVAPQGKTDPSALISVLPTLPLDAQTQLLEMLREQGAA